MLWTKVQQNWIHVLLPVPVFHKFYDFLRWLQGAYVLELVCVKWEEEKTSYLYWESNIDFLIVQTLV
jgi:hypothetical protein